MSLLLSAAALPFLLHSQEIIYVDTSLATFAPQIEQGTINLNSCSDTILGEILTFKAASDIAIRPDGEVYGYAATNWPGDTMLYNGEMSWTGLVYPNLVYYDPQITGVTCDENNFVYTAGLGITKYWLQCCTYQEIYLGDLPPGMQCQGDITYRQGKFYVAAIGNKLVEVNMKNPSESKIVMDFPPGTLPIHGLATVQLGCDSVATYAIGRAPDHSEVYFIDFDNWTTTLVCDMPELAITGAGSYTECMLPPCDVFVDLDNDNSSFGFRGDFCGEKFCAPPAAVADTDVVILSATGLLDSLSLQLTGVLDAGQEYLTAGPVNNLAVAGNNSGWLTFVNTGSATLQDFEAAIKAVLFQNDALVVTYGKRKVLVRGWAGGVSSPVSVAELMLDNSVLQLTADVTPPACFGFSTGSAGLSASGGMAPYDFQWQGGQQGSTVSGLSSGVYPLVISDAAGCVKADTVVVGQPDLLAVSVSYTGPSSLCDNSGILAANASGGTAPYAFAWDNGAAGPDPVSVGPGAYQLTVTDANGCTATAGYDIAEGDTVLVLQTAAICEGESFSWGGAVFYADTLTCQVVPQAGGCDSTVCLQLAVHPLPVVAITADGDFCDSDQVSLSAGQHAAYLWAGGSTSPALSVSTPGVYSVTVTNGFGCTAEASLALSAGVQFDWQTDDPTCSGIDDGRIVFENAAGGTPPLQFSIDGGAQFSTSPVFENLPPGVYTLVAEDAGGCRSEAEAVLMAPVPVTVDAGEDQSIQLGQTVTLSAQTNLLNPVVYWQPPDFLDCTDCLSANASPLQTIRYEVQVQDANGCTAKDEVTVTVDRQNRVYVPNAFSPNGDGINDRLTVFGSPAVASVASFRVFDRWGGLVFDGVNLAPNDPASGWDGNMKGKAALPGVYVYLIEIRLADGRTEMVEGEVLLVR